MNKALSAILVFAVGTAAAETFSLSAWICPKALSANAPIVVFTGDAEGRSDGFGLFLGDDGSLCAYARSAADEANVAVGAIPDEGEWSHVCLSYDGTCTRLYLASALQCVATNGVGSTEGEGEFYIGDDGFCAFDGEISDVELFDEALSADDVSRLAHDWSDESAAKEDEGTPPPGNPGDDGLAPPALQAQTAELTSASPRKAALTERLRRMGRTSTRCRKSARPVLKVHTRLEE